MTLFWWMSPPGTKEGGTTVLYFTYKGQSQRLLLHVKYQLQVSAYIINTIEFCNSCNCLLRTTGKECMDLNFTGTKLLRIAKFHNFIFVDPGYFYMHYKYA